jgi:transcriptional regulator with XRE-family HTH domain
MNYSRIKSELERRDLTIKKFCREVDITEQGLHQMIRNESMKIEVLERISVALGVPVAYWFDDDTEEATPRDGKPPKALDIERIDTLTAELNTLLKSVVKN